MKKWVLCFFTLFFAMSLVMPGSTVTAKSEGTKPGGPFLQEAQKVQWSSIQSYEEMKNTLDQLEQRNPDRIRVEKVGESVEGRDLLAAKVGHGNQVFWVQGRIHGDEVLGTESVLHILKVLTQSGHPDVLRILDELTIVAIPMYNPDGAEANRRHNANGIDLNRDWSDLSQPESRAFYELWKKTKPRYAMDLHHFENYPGGYYTQEGTDNLVSLQMGTYSVDPARLTPEQALTNKQMAMASVESVSHLQQAHIAKYMDIDITNAVLSRMLLGGQESEIDDIHFQTTGAIFLEVRSAGQKKKGWREQLFTVPTLSVLDRVATGTLAEQDTTGWEDIPYAEWHPRDYDPKKGDPRGY